MPHVAAVSAVSVSVAFPAIFSEVTVVQRAKLPEMTVVPAAYIRVLLVAGSPPTPLTRFHCVRENVLCPLRFRLSLPLLAPSFCSCLALRLLSRWLSFPLPPKLAGPPSPDPTATFSALGPSAGVHALRSACLPLPPCWSWKSWWRRIWGASLRPSET